LPARDLKNKAMPSKAMQTTETLRSPEITKIKESGRTMAKKIMIVDDEQDIRTTVKQVLERHGYEVVSAVNGDDCLKKISAGEKPDLILLDIMMPGTPVKDVVSKLGKFKVAYLSVVRTSEAEKENLMKSKNTVDFIQKPFDIDKLLNVVKKLVG